MDEKIAKIEKLAKDIENEKNFDESVKKFNEVAVLVKDALADGKRQKGKITEVIKEIDKYVEKELKTEEEE